MKIELFWKFFNHEGTKGTKKYLIADYADLRRFFCQPMRTWQRLSRYQYLWSLRPVSAGPSEMARIRICRLAK